MSPRLGPWTDAGEAWSLRSCWLSQGVSAVFPRLAHVMAVTSTLYEDTVDTETADAVAVCVLEAED